MTRLHKGRYECRADRPFLRKGLAASDAVYTEIAMVSIGLSKLAQC